MMRRHEWLVALAMAVSPIQTWACIEGRLPPRGPDETEPAYQARLKAEQDKQAAYASLSDHDRALVDQARWWADYPIIFLARVEKIRVGRTVYPPPPEKPKFIKLNGRPVPLPARVPYVPRPDPGRSHSAFIRPLLWLKGDPAFAASWQIVGGRTSCGGPPDGDLGYAWPNDQVIIFADWATTIRTVRGKDVSTQSLDLFGIMRKDAVDPHILAGLRARRK